MHIYMGLRDRKNEKKRKEKRREEKREVKDGVWVREADGGLSGKDAMHGVLMREEEVEEGR
jgi:hypothetical protein